MITAVIVPFHNEEQLLPDCLESIGAVGPDLTVLVADTCSDRSELIANRWARDRNAIVVTTSARSVGAARAAGIAAVLQTIDERKHVWLANTDADSRVPSNWLDVQLSANVDAFAGTVEVLDWGEHSPTVSRVFRSFYERTMHVHGANLGVRADAYVEVGGFPSVPTGEDHALWNALASHRRVFSREAPVVTSARRCGRAPHGFAGFLTAIAS
ncbi:MAG: glycosyltransferase [Kofleriaceae bacterium]